MDPDQYVGVEFVDLDQEITKRFLQSTQRIKFSLVSVSHKYVVLVARSGSLYIYSREPLQFLVLVPSNRRIGSIERILVSPQSNYVLLANSKGELFLQSISSAEGSLSDLLAYNKNLPDAKFVGSAASTVTCLFWTSDEKQLFFGDLNGNVSVLNVGHFLNGNLLHTTIHPILALDSEIVQIDGFDLLLIVSTRTGCILCNTDREEFKQIGNRPRDGLFGACFMNKSIDEFLRGNLICSRPGARFWVVDYGGIVKQTLQFKEVLTRSPCRPLGSDYNTKTDKSNESQSANTKKYSTPSVSFAKLIELTVDEAHFLVTYTKSGVYVFEPLQSRLILWTDNFQNIVDVFVVDQTIYCVTEAGPGAGISIGSFKVCSTQHAFEGLLASGVYESMKEFIEANRGFLKSMSIAESLRPKMELTKEWLIQKQEYECLAIISNIGYRPDESKTCNETVNVLTLKRDPADKTTRTMIASALRNTFNLFSQAAAGRGLGGGIGNSDLIRANGELSLRTNPQHQKRLELFREITTNFSNSGANATEDVIVDKKKFFGNRKFRKLSELLKTNEGQDDDTLKESKLLKNLFLIFKSSRMGHVNMVERYAPMLDKMSLEELLRLMGKLELVMKDNEYSDTEARQNSSVLLLDYLKPSAINDELDNETLVELIQRYVLVNQSKGRAKCCQNCSFPLEITEECLYFDFGRTLFEFLYARGDGQYETLLKNVPYLLNIFLKYYREDAEQRDSYLQLLFILRKFSVANGLAGEDWSQLLDLMSELTINNIIKCFNCKSWNGISVPNEVLELPEEHSWNFMLNQAARFMGGPALLKEVLKHSNAIKNGEVSKQFFLKCMQTA